MINTETWFKHKETNDKKNTVDWWPSVRRRQLRDLSLPLKMRYAQSAY